MKKQRKFSQKTEKVLISLGTDICKNACLMSAIIAIGPRRKRTRISQSSGNRQDPDSNNSFIEGSTLYFEDPSSIIVTFEVSRFSFTTGNGEDNVNYLVHKFRLLSL